jgi:hypothetical protein
MAILYPPTTLRRWKFLAGGLGSLGATSIAREYAVVLKARDAQMDARSYQAQKTRGRQGRICTRATATGLF